MAFATPHRLYRDYMQPGLPEGTFTSGAYTELAAGPPRLANLGGPTVLSALNQASSGVLDQIFYPLGIIQTFQHSTQMNLTRLFELGSQRSYFIPGRVVGQLGVSRAMYHGMSLLRLLYAYYPDLLPPTIINPAFANIGAGLVANGHNVIVPPGYENIFLNLASDLFTQAVGLLMILKDSNEDSLGAGYFESLYTPQHTFSTDASGTVIQESVSMQYERFVPMAVQAVPLITGLAA